MSKYDIRPHFNRILNVKIRYSARLCKMENEKRKAKNEKQKTISEKRKAKNKKRVTKNEKQTNFSLLEKIWIYLGLLKRYIHAERLFWYTLLLVSGQGGKPFIFFFNQSVC